MLRLRSSISASILFHFFFAMICAALLQRQLQQPAPAPKLTWIELDPAVPAKPRKDEQDSSRKQIVQTIPGQTSDTPAKDAFLGERTQTVDRETVSKTRSTSIGAVPNAAPATESERRKTAERKKIDPITGQNAPLARFGLPVLPTTMPSEEQRREIAQQERNWATPGTQLSDYVKGLKEGEQTALNTREFVFYGYFNRIRSKLDRAWVPILRERLGKFFRSGRNLASDQEHATRVLVVLNAAGEITRVEIVNESGVKVLDDAAVQAFNRAGPFPNPPKGLVDARGEIQVPWEFVLRT